MTNIGIIDLGSNSVRMTVLNRENGEVLFRGKNAIKLSEGMNEDMLIKGEPVKRCVDALLIFINIMKKFDVCEVFACATAAVRKAKNQEEFLKAVKDQTGISIRVLSGEEEAKLDFAGVASRTGISNGVILDTGGGSVEFIGIKNGKMTDCESVQIGSRSIKELFFKEGENEKTRALAKAKISEIIKGLDWLKNFGKAPIVGIGGSNRTVAKICAEETEDKVIDCFTVKRAKVLEIFSKIENANLNERRAIKGITEDRADIIYGGLMPLTALMEEIESEELIITDAGLQDGIAVQIMKNGKSF